MATARSLPCGAEDFDYRYRVEFASGSVDLSADIPTEVPDGATFWRRHGGLWVEIIQPTAAEYKTAF